MLFRNKYLLTLLAACTLITAVAQKKQYTMAEAVNGLSGPLAPKGVKGAQWRPGTHDMYFLEGKFWLKYSADNGRTDTVDNVTHLNNLLFWQEKIEEMPGRKWVTKNKNYFIRDSTLYTQILEPPVSNLYHIPKNAQNITFPIFDKNRHDTTDEFFAATIENNLSLFSWGNTLKVTSDTNPNIINGQSVHRDEFGINGGIFFSPKGNYLAYYRMDQTMVKDYPVIDWSEIPAKATNVKYPMAGDSSHQVTLRVYNVATQKTITLKTGEHEKDHYLTCVTWSPDEKYIYVAILNRGQNHLWLNQYSATTGEKIKTLFEETSDKYVEPQHPLAFLPDDNDAMGGRDAMHRVSTTKFIWWSQRDGYMHLWLCDMENASIKCLTPGDYVVNEIIGFNKRTGEVLITSAKEDPREKHGYAVNWKTGKMRRLDTEPGTHTYTASDDGEYLFDVFSAENSEIKFDQHDSDIMDVRRSPVLIAKSGVIRSVDGKIVKAIVESTNPLSNFQRPLVTEATLYAKDDTRLYGKLIYPTNFDAHKKYPVIVYLYNGPHVQLVKNAFPASGNLWYEYMAQHGYIVWVMDGRGSSNRGLKFEQATFRHLGTVEMEDQLRGVEYLKSLPFVDSTRMGVHGWSFGGFMTTSLMLRHPGVFKVGVAGGPVMDWRMYEVMYGERYMDTPEENPEGYKEAALFDKAKNLKGKLLLIHGTQDATVVWQHSIKFLKASVDQGVQVDYFVYPGYEHNVRGKDRVHLMQKVTDYFDQYLK